MLLWHLYCTVLEEFKLRDFQRAGRKPNVMGYVVNERTINTVQIGGKQHRHPRMEDIVNDFRHWFLHHGGFFGEHVELHYHPLRGLHLRVSQKSIMKPGSCIISCPHVLSLSSFNANHSHNPFTDQFGDDAAGETGPLSNLNLLRFFLIEQYRLGSQSFWWPYIHTLPHPSADYPFNTPMYYHDDDKKWLQGTSLAHSTRIIDQTWREEHAQGLRRLRNGNFDRYPWSVHSRP